MDFESFYNTIQPFKIERDEIFLSYDHSDSKLVQRINVSLETRHVKKWSMHKGLGRETNTVGDDYREIINTNLNKTCLFLLFVSLNSVNSAQVLEELKYISPAVKSHDAFVLPIYLVKPDDIKLPDSWKEVIDHDDRTIITFYYDENTPSENIETYCEEILYKYAEFIGKQMSKRYRQLKESHKIVDLLRYCIKHDCTMRLISEDIKNSSEVSRDSSLKEVHSLSSELKEYDCHPYSCMVIANNLIGIAKNENGIKRYNPNECGVRYYYYMTDDYKRRNWDYVQKKIRSYLEKSKESREEVVRLVRREFCLHNRLSTFFAELNGLDNDGFIDKYRITNDDFKKKARELFKCDDYDVYFEYSPDSKEAFRVPNEFLSWLLGTRDGYYADEAAEAYKFITFLRKFLDILKNMTETNEAFVKEFETKVVSLERLRQFEMWQEGYDALNNVSYEIERQSEAVKLVNFLLNGTADIDEQIKGGAGDRKFPRLAKWLMFEYDENNKRKSCDVETVNQALRNLHAITVISNDDIAALCSSFVLYIGTDRMDAGWYTTSRRESRGYVEYTVISYELLDAKEEYKKFLDVFSFLVKINPEAKKILSDSNSMLLKNMSFNA